MQPDLDPSTSIWHADCSPTANGPWRPIRTIGPGLDRSFTAGTGVFRPFTTTKSPEESLLMNSADGILTERTKPARSSATAYSI